ncbi:MAG TPA: HemK/PrmC family methyltransferase, partial [Atribacterota bacterium]|nr:HemK/PrmC family methyltransferase [Atribacterota bacterium]
MDEKKKNIGELLEDGELILKKSGNKNAAEESLILLSYLLKREKFDIFLNRSLDVSFRENQRYNEWLDKRAKGIPIQYITGFQNFMGMEFKVAKGVFIPRPETEILVEQLIKLIESMPNGIELFFLDIGVGSGIIPVSICQYFQKSNKNIHFYAVDISMKAIKLAEENAKRFKCEDRITFVHGDIFCA